MKTEKIIEIIRLVEVISLLLMLLILPDQSLAEGGDLIWYQSYNLNQTDDFTRGFDAKPTMDGGYILTGETFSSPDLGGDGRTRAFLLKADEFGQTLWARHYDFTDGGQYDYTAIAALVPSSDYYFLFGHKTCPDSIISPDAEIGVFLFKISNLEGSEGDTIWTRLYDRDINVNFYVRNVCQTNDGGYAVFGYTDDPTQDLGSTGGFMIKLDADGNKEWSRIYDQETDPLYFMESMDVRAGIQTTDGDYVLAGTYEVMYSEGGTLSRYSFMAKTNSSGQIIWTKNLTGYDDTINSIRQIVNGYFICAFLNNDYLPPEDRNQPFGVMKVNDTGNYLWGTSLFPLGCDRGMVCETVEPLTVIGEDAGYIACGYEYRYIESEYGYNAFYYPMLVNVAPDDNLRWIGYYDRYVHGVDEIMGSYSLNMQITEQGNYLVSGVVPGLAYEDSVLARDRGFMLLVEGFVVTGIDDDNSLPKEFTLSQNYPNPFNMSTVISYEMAYDAEIKLDIYDILGRKVATLVDEYQTAGTHSVVWNADSEASGVYFYKIQADGITDGKQMLLIK